MGLKGLLSMVSNRDTCSWRCAPVPKHPDLGDCCERVDGSPPARPDFATYRQDEQFALGNTPSWDSPDIVRNYWAPPRARPQPLSAGHRTLSKSPTAERVTLTGRKETRFQTSYNRCGRESSKALRHQSVPYHGGTDVSRNSRTTSCYFVGLTRCGRS
jgi:hypothetical protein